ncbi:28S ribosomal protein S35, mitochondrial [Ascosphaera aggregata]|nr:28S ribosomal protein S35, mitochondrial [Ascosphaera aggregata]
MASILRPFTRAAAYLARQPVVRTQPPTRLTAPTRQILARQFSHARPLRYQQEDGGEANNGSFKVAPFTPDVLTPTELEEYNCLTPEQRKEFTSEMEEAIEVLRNSDETAEALRQMERDIFEVERDVDYPTSIPRVKPEGFWAEDEEDEFARAKDGDDYFNDDDITTIAHTELDAHRDVRHYARIAAWEMPLLSKLAKPFEPPSKEQILRFRYTTYMGENHPAQEKVVVELRSKDLVPTYLTEAQRQTLLKLVGPRYKPDKDIIRMSCEKFSTRAQNKRYLGDLIQTLIRESRDEANNSAFKDIPLDLRHHKPKTKYAFPKEWEITPEKKKQLEALRQEQQQAAERQVFVVDGNEVVLDAAPKSRAREPARFGTRR